jgi:hypothetical protein
MKMYSGSWRAVVPAFGVLLMALLSACGDGGNSGGGGGASYTIGGSVTGLASGASLVLQDNGGDNLTLGANGSFAFASKIAGGGSYAITVLTQPTNQNCTVTAGSGTASAAVTTVAVSCTNTMVSVPNVIGSSQAAATTTITGAGLKLGTVTMQSSTTVASGNVISENPAAGTSVASGSAVALVVSSGTAASTVTLGGTVIGLGTAATVHVLNGADDVSVSGNTGFTFPTSLTSGTAYSVTVGSPQPTGKTCAVQNGAGTADSVNITNVVVYCTTNVTAATATGPYTAVSNDLSQQIDALNALNLDGVGTYTDSVTQDFNGVITTTSAPGTYAVTDVNSVPILSTNGGAGAGAIEFNGNAAILLTSASGGSPPGILVGVKQAQNASASTVNGIYTSVSLENTGTISASLSSVTLNNGTGAFGAAQRNTNGTLSTVPANPAGTYTVSSSGSITVGTGGDGISGAVGADGDLIVAAPITSNGNGSTPGIYILVKQGSGVTAATFNGIYTLVSLSTGASLSGTDGRAYTLGIANGSFAGVYAENNAGTSSTNNSVAGAYTLGADGTVQWTITGGATLTGTLSADGNVFVLTDLTSGQAPTLLVGVRQ